MTADPLRPHITHRFDEELEDICRRVMNMGGLVEKQLDGAIQALVEGDSARGEQVMSGDHRVNEMEVAIDEACTLLLARRQPVALDLRLVMAVAKTINDLERIGDETKEVARAAVKLTGNPHVTAHVSQMEHMGERVRRMLRKSLDALARFDANAASELTTDDEKVDRDHDGVMRQMLTLMMEDPRNIPEVIQLCWCARALERIGDRCRNIGEYVIYLVRGVDVRHSTVEPCDEPGKEGDTGRD